MWIFDNWHNGSGGSQGIRRQLGKLDSFMMDRIGGKKKIRTYTRRDNALPSSRLQGLICRCRGTKQYLPSNCKLASEYHVFTAPYL